MRTGFNTTNGASRNALFTPTLPGSTPMKTDTAKVQSKGDPPSLEEMEHQELIDLVKRLLEERASKPTPFANPNKDATVVGQKLHGKNY